MTLPNTSDFERIVHLVPGEDEEYGAEWPQMPIIGIKYRKGGYAPEARSRGTKSGSKPTLLESPPTFRFRSHSTEVGRLIGDVARYHWDNQEEINTQDTFQQMVLHLRGIQHHVRRVWLR